MNISFPGESAEYREARDHLLKEEIALRRAMESVAEARRKLPPGGLVPEDYIFIEINHEGLPDRVKLSELFAPGKNTLVIYNFMFPRMPQDSRPGPSTGATAKLSLLEGPCPSCTCFLDSLNASATHIEAGGLNLAVVAKAPAERLSAFARERGWQNLRLLSAAENNFKRDYHGETAEGMQLPLITVFNSENASQIRHFWSSEMIFAGSDPGQDPRHNGTLELIYNMFDLSPGGTAEPLECAT